MDVVMGRGEEAGDASATSTVEVGSTRMVEDGDAPTVSEAEQRELYRDDDGGTTCRTECTRYECNCYCCQSVYDHRCDINCETHYEVWMDIQFRLKSSGTGLAPARARAAL